MKTFSLLILATAPLLALASFCGESSVPFSFEALPNGQPVLGCARPTCFGWTADGSPAGSASSFYRVNRKPDGYFRKSAETPRAIAATDAKNFKAQTAQCAATFDSEQCPSESQWVGGFGPVLNASELPLAVQCCEYEPLKLSEDRGVAVVNAGQIVIGGEVLNNGRQYAFDYISDVVKHTAPDGKVSYDVSIRRLPCLPYPTEFTVNVDKAVEEEMLRRFGKDKKSPNNTLKNGRARAHADPIRNVVNGDIPSDPKLVALAHQEPIVEVQEPIAQQAVVEQVPQQAVVENIEGPFVAENDAVIEETNALPPGEQAIEGILLPENAAPNVVNPPADVAGGAGSYYYPVGGAGGGNGFFCFAADTKVILQGGAEKRMDELEVDDWILSGNKNGIVYSHVESWLHRMPETLADFLRFEMDDGTELKLTNKHYIFRGDCSQAGEIVSIDRMNADMVYAEEVSQDQCLFVLKDGTDFVETRISKIDIVKEKGIYAPLTHSGNLVANKVYASCFNIIENRNMQYALSVQLRDFANSFWAKLWTSEDSNDVSEIELVPGMQTFVDLIKLIVNSK